MAYQPIEHACYFILVEKHFYNNRPGTFPTELVSLLLYVVFMSGFDKNCKERNLI